MVKFGKYLSSHSIPEWSTQYVRYKRLKKLLKKVELEYDERENATATATVAPAQGQTNVLDTLQHHDQNGPSENKLVAAVAAALHLGGGSRVSQDGLTPQQKIHLVQMREQRKKAAKQGNGGKAMNGERTDTASKVDNELHKGAEWIARTRAAVLDTNRRLDQEQSQDAEGMKGRRLSQVNLADVSRAAEEAATSSKFPPVVKQPSYADFNDDEPPDAPEHDDQKSLDIAMNEGKKHATDSSLVAEDPNIQRLTRYIPAHISATFTPSEWSFFKILEEDLLTINHFFLKQEEFFLDKINVIVEQLDRLIREEEQHQAEANGSAYRTVQPSSSQSPPPQTIQSTSNSNSGHPMPHFLNETAPGQSHVSEKDRLRRIATSARMREDAKGVDAEEDPGAVAEAAEAFRVNQIELADLLRRNERSARTGFLSPATPAVPTFHFDDENAHTQSSTSHPPAGPPSPPAIPPPPTEFPPTVHADPSAVVSGQNTRLTRQESSSGAGISTIGGTLGQVASGGDSGQESTADDDDPESGENDSSVYGSDEERKENQMTNNPSLGSTTQTHADQQSTNLSPPPRSPPSYTAITAPASGSGVASVTDDPNHSTISPPTASYSQGSNGSPSGDQGGSASVSPPVTTQAQALAQNMHLHLKFRLLTAQKPWRVLEKALQELYRGLHLLRNYKILNFTAFVKVLKKYDKMNLHGDWKAGLTLLPRIQSTHFLASPILKAFIRRVELIFAQTFTSGDQKAALENLRVVPTPMKPAVLFQLGLLLGLSGFLFALLLFMVGWVSGGAQGHVNMTFQVSLPVWRGLGLVILHLWGWSICVMLFHRYRINYSFIFEVNSRTELKHEQLIVATATLSCIWFFLIDLYVFLGLAKSAGTWPDIDTGWVPFTLFVVFFFICLMPFDLFFRPTRLFILRLLGKIVTAPFHSIDFASFYTADQLCSLVNVFGDLMFSFCWIFSGDFTNGIDQDNSCANVQSTAVWLLACLPYWWRLLQCLRKYYDAPEANKRQLWNVGKYSFSIFTTLLSLLNRRFPGKGFQPVWISVAAFSTLYSYLWDIYCDFGFVQIENGKFLFLSRKLVLNNHLPYYFAIISNLALRVAWVLSISPTNFGLSLRADVFNSIIWSLEVLRRNQWNFYRLENEHLTNCEHYRVVNIVPLNMNMSPMLTNVDSSSQPVGDSTSPEDGTITKPIEHSVGGGRGVSDATIPVSPSIHHVDGGDEDHGSVGAGDSAPLIPKTFSTRLLDEQNARFSSAMLTAPDARNLDPDRHDDPDLHDATFHPSQSREEEDEQDRLEKDEREHSDQWKEKVKFHLSPSPGGRHESERSPAYPRSPVYDHGSTEEERKQRSPSPPPDSSIGDLLAVPTYTNPYLQHYANVMCETEITKQPALAQVVQARRSRQSSRSVSSNDRTERSQQHEATSPMIHSPVPVPTSSTVPSIVIHTDETVPREPAPSEPVRRHSHPSMHAVALAAMTAPRLSRGMSEPEAHHAPPSRSRTYTDQVGMLSPQVSSRHSSRRPSLQSGTHAGAASMAANLHLYGGGGGEGGSPSPGPQTGRARAGSKAGLDLGELSPPPSHPPSSILHRSRRLSWSHKPDAITQLEEDDQLRTSQFDQPASSVTAASAIGASGGSGPSSGAPSRPTSPYQDPQVTGVPPNVPPADAIADDLFERALARRKSITNRSTPHLAHHSLAHVVGAVMSPPGGMMHRGPPHRTHTSIGHPASLHHMSSIVNLMTPATRHTGTSHHVPQHAETVHVPNESAHNQDAARIDASQWTV